MKAQSKNRDPFSRIPIPKSFYHPSQQNTLTKTQRKIALSPSKESRVSPEDEAFLKGSNIYSSQTPPTRENDFGPSKFDESWPSSERPSIASTSGYDRSDMTLASDVKQSLFAHLDPVEEKSKTGSVLQRYVNRFRNSAPMSREERVQKGVGHDQDFWWLGKTSDPTLTPASSSTPKDEEGGRSRQFIDRSESQAYKDTFQSLSSARKRRSQLEDDIAIQKLQEKADRILGQSESSMGSLEAGPAVSSDGIASSESQSSSFDEPTITPRPPYRPGFKDTRDRDIQARSKSRNEDILSYKASIKRPEDDILYQWRLQRKMDLSRHGAAELMAKNNSEVQSKLKEIQQRVLIKDMSDSGSRPQLSTPRFTSAPSRNDDDYTYKEIPSTSLQEPEKLPKQMSQKPFIASPTLSRKQQGDKENVEPHLHLMCDVLPCPHAQKYQEQFKNLYPGAESLPNGGGAKNMGVSKMQQSEHTASKVVSDSRHNGKTDNVKDLRENKRYLDAETPQTDPKNRDSAKVKSKGAQFKSSAESLNRVTSPTDSYNRLVSPEVEADSKYPNVVKSTESVDFESSDLDVTDREKETLQDEEIVHSKDSGSSNRIPKSPTKSKILHPRYSSSPARSTPPISSAIGQTVKDYMFTASSSVDSMTSLLSNIADSSPDRQQTPSSRRQGQPSSGEHSEQTYSSRGQSHSSGRRQGQPISGEHSEQTSSSRGQIQSSSRQGQSFNGEHSEQTYSSRGQSHSSRHQEQPTSGEHLEQIHSSNRRQTESTSRQQREASETTRNHQTSSSRRQKEFSRRPKSPTSSQQHEQSSRQYKDQRESSRSRVREGNSSGFLVRSSEDQRMWSGKDQDQSSWSSRDLEDPDEDTRYSAEIAHDDDDDENVSDEEFFDDQLLKLLRQQRNDLEKKLGEIDQQLLEE